MLRSILRTVVKFLFATLTHLEVEGQGNIPRQGAAILAANHVSIVDAPLVFLLLPREDATGLVADKYQKNPLFRWLVDAAKGIWIHREAADSRALRDAVAFLQGGGLLGIAPEGTRSHTGGLIPAKTGVAFLAEKACQATGHPIPIVPMAIAGSERAFPELLRLRRASIQVRIGKPFTLPPLAQAGRSAALQRNTDEIMCRIAALLPEGYRGFYAGHPRLGELAGPNPQT